MRTIAAAASLLILACEPVQAQRACDHATGTSMTGAAGPTQFVPPVAGQRVYVCGYVLTGDGQTLDFQLWSGTGTDCATDKTPVTPRIVLGSGQALVNRSAVPGERTPPGHALCAQTFAGVGSATLVLIVYWAQF